MFLLFLLLLTLPISILSTSPAPRLGFEYTRTPCNLLTQPPKPTNPSPASISPMQPTAPPPTTPSKTSTPSPTSATQPLQPTKTASQNLKDPSKVVSSKKVKSVIPVIKRHQVNFFSLVLLSREQHNLKIVYFWIFLFLGML
jgi:hypothetical protein